MPSTRDLAFVQTRLALKYELIAVLLLHLLQSSVKSNLCVHSRVLGRRMVQGGNFVIARDVIKVSLP